MARPCVFEPHRELGRTLGSIQSQASSLPRAAAGDPAEAKCGKMPLLCSRFCAEGKQLAGLGVRLSFLGVSEVWVASRLHRTQRLERPPIPAPPTCVSRGGLTLLSLGILIFKTRKVSMAPPPHGTAHINPAWTSACTPVSARCEVGCSFFVRKTRHPLCHPLCHRHHSSRVLPSSGATSSTMSFC